MATASPLIFYHSPNTRSSGTFILLEELGVPYEMRVLGAYLGIYLRQLERFLSGKDMGSPRLVHIEKEAAHIYAIPLPDGYCLALVQHQPGLVGHARQSLTEAAEQLRQELF